MAKKGKKIAEASVNILATPFVREIEAPLLPAPPSEVGVKGWLYHHIFQSMSDFSSVQSCVKSVLTALFTGIVFYFFATQIFLVDEGDEYVLYRNDRKRPFDRLVLYFFSMRLVV